MLWFAVALGGAVGATARYAVARLFPIHPDAFPWATFTVNVLGCLAIGWCLAHVERDRFSPEVRVALVTGLLGSFTTFSTFGAESFALLQNGRGGLAAVYVASSFLLGLGAVALGRAVAA